MSVQEFKEIISDIVNDKDVDVDQASRIIGLKKGTSYIYMHNNQIPYSKSGRKIVFDRDELVE